MNRTISGNELKFCFKSFRKSIVAAKNSRFYERRCGFQCLDISRAREASRMNGMVGASHFEWLTLTASDLPWIGIQDTSFESDGLKWNPWTFEGWTRCTVLDQLEQLMWSNHSECSPDVLCVWMVTPFISRRRWVVKNEKMKWIWAVWKNPAKCFLTISGCKLSAEYLSRGNSFLIGGTAAVLLDDTIWGCIARCRYAINGEIWKVHNDWQVNVGRYIGGGCRLGYRSRYRCRWLKKMMTGRIRWLCLLLCADSRLGTYRI